MNTQKGAITIWIIIILLVLGGGVYFFVMDNNQSNTEISTPSSNEAETQNIEQNTPQQQNNQTQQNTPSPSIDNFYIVKNQSNVVVQSWGMESMEIWYIPTGTGIKPSNYVLWGNATLSSTDPNGLQTWIFNYANKDQILATHLFARGYVNGTQEDEFTFATQGATAIHNALY